LNLVPKREYLSIKLKFNSLSNWKYQASSGIVVVRINFGNSIQSTQ